jgi:hypothetical protein
VINTLKKKLRIDFSKNTKLTFYLRGLWLVYAPRLLFNNLGQQYNTLSEAKKAYVDDRVDYYNKLNKNFKLPEDAKTVSEFKKQQKRKTYFYDLYEYLRHFPSKSKITYFFGDITYTPEAPAIVKSRPIDGDNQNSILLKLNKIRHFIFVYDTIPFKDKKDMLVWRGKVHQPHRKAFLEKFFNHPLCNIGQTNTKANDHSHWQKEKLSLKEMLQYKFILAIEGKDVASNLKWVMSSNSLAMMVKPTYETWFMEGRLIPNHHYVLLKDDYSDLEEKIDYYAEHVDEAEAIINNAHAYVEPFKNKHLEDMIAYGVLTKYYDFAEE